MKSVVQEASSIAKAVEQGWLKAGKPQEFSIKVLEEPQKNFLGMTTKSAKVALFFTDKQPTPRPEPRQRPQPEREQREPRSGGEYREKREKQRAPEHVESAQPQEQQTRQMQPLWTAAMVAIVQDWMHEVLRIMEKNSIQYKVEQHNFHIRITLSSPLLETPEKEKHLLASFSTVILETLKRKFKMGLRGHKIVLTHA